MMEAPISVSSVRASSMRYLVGYALTLVPAAYLLATRSFAYGGLLIIVLLAMSGPIGTLIMRFDRTRFRAAYATIDDDGLRFDGRTIRWSDLTHAREFTERSGRGALVVQTHDTRIAVENPKQGAASEKPYWAMRDRVPIDIELSSDEAGYGPVWYHLIVKRRRSR